MKFNKRISRLLAKLMLSSLAFSGGVVQTSAIEQQQERVPTQNELCDLLGMLYPEEQKDFVKILSYGFGWYKVDGTHLEDLHFYEYLKDFAKKNGLSDIVLCYADDYFSHLDVKWGIITDYEQSNILQMIYKAKELVSTLQPLLPRLRNYIPPQIEPQLNDLEENDSENEKQYKLDDFEIQYVYETKLVNKNDICVVCLDQLKDGPYLTLPCRHSGHKECFKKWLENKNVCPICKAQIQPRNQNNASVLIESQKLIKFNEHSCLNEKNNDN